MRLTKKKLVDGRRKKTKVSLSYRGMGNLMI